MALERSQTINIRDGNGMLGCWAAVVLVALVSCLIPIQAQTPAAKDDQPDISKNVFCLAISNDSKWLVTGSIDGTASLWELASGKEVRVFRGHSSFHRSGKLLGGTWTSSGPGWVTSVAISADGKL